MKKCIGLVVLLLLTGFSMPAQAKEPVSLEDVVQCAATLVQVQVGRLPNDPGISAEIAQDCALLAYSFVIQFSQCWADTLSKDSTPIAVTDYPGYIGSVIGQWKVPVPIPPTNPLGRDAELQSGYPTQGWTVLYVSLGSCL